MLTFYQFIYLQFNILAIVHNFFFKLVCYHVTCVLFFVCVCYFSVHYLVFFQLHLCEIKLQMLTDTTVYSTTILQYYCIYSTVHSKICYRYNL